MQKLRVLLRNGKWRYEVSISHEHLSLMLHVRHVKKNGCIRMSPCRDADYVGRLRQHCRDVEKQKYVLLILRRYFVPIAHVYIIYQRITLLRWERGFALRASWQASLGIYCLVKTFQNKLCGNSSCLRSSGVLNENADCWIFLTK
jgi:hypothetical protein